MPVSLVAVGWPVPPGAGLPGEGCAFPRLDAQLPRSSLQRVNGVKIAHRANRFESFEASATDPQTWQWRRLNVRDITNGVSESFTMLAVASTRLSWARSMNRSGALADR